MKLSKEIATSSFDKFEVLHWNKQAVYKYHPRIESYLSIRLNDFKGRLAQPKLIVQEGVKIALSWRIILDDDDIAISLNVLRETNDNAALEKVAKQLNILKNFIQNLQKSSNEEDKEWGSLLGLCIDNVQETSIFFVQESIVITGWGVSEISSKYFPLVFSSEGVVPDEQSKDIGIQNEEKSIIEEEVKEEEIEIEDNEPIKEYNKVLEESDHIPEVAENTAADETTNIVQSNQDELPNEEIKQNRGDDNIPPKKNNWFKNFFGKFNYWWLLLLLLLIIFIFWKSCDFQNKQSYLPPAPNVIIPIDSNDIVLDEDSIRMIVGDRINIILKDKNQNVADFVADFKKEYKDKNYKVIYYDTLINRIQIQVPAKERERLMKEIPQKLSAFKMLIWHEGIFKRNALPSDPAFSDASKAWYIDAIKVQSAWNKSYGDKKIVVAIIDDGFDLQHKELAGHITRQWNVVSRNRNVFTNKKAQHGSHVAGTAVGNRDNNSGLAGIAPDCMLMPVQVADANGLISTTAVIDAVLYAINQGADVINLSLGMMADPRIAKYPISVQRDIIKNSYHGEEAFWNEILMIAEENNVVVVMAAGNDNVLVGLDPMQRSHLAIKVSAVGHNIQKAGFSNFGENSTVSAPGVGIYSSIPSNRYTYMDGTSMAAPIVAGAVALLKSINSDLKPSEIRNLLVNTGIPLSANIGPLIQLGKALELIDDDSAIKNPDKIDCDKIQSKIDSLLQEVERLQRICPDASVKDTMRMPDIIKNLDFSIGRWKSTTSIHNNEGEEVTIYFDFNKNRQGLLTLVEPDGLKCTADLSLKANTRQFNVNQLQEAECTDKKTYQSYTFSCQADANGYAECTAQNKTVKANRFKFKLIKIR
jgi:subtilisin family serine protease